jgi:hypothetical protein
LNAIELAQRLVQPFLANLWAATIILAAGTTIMMAGGEESKAA